MQPFDIVELGKITPLPAPLLESSVGETLLTDLQNAGILSRMEIQDNHLVQARRFVGSCGFPGCQIRILPRYPDFYSKISEYLRATRVKQAILRYGDQAGSEGEIEDDNPLRLFLEKFIEVLNSGLPFEYVSAAARTTSPQGTLMLAQSMSQIWSQGKTYEAFFRISERKIPESLCVVLQTASSVVVQSNALSSRDNGLLERCCLMLDVYPAQDESKALHLAQQLFRQTESKSIGELLSLAIAVLGGESHLQPVVIQSRNVTARFYCVDILWELTVYSVVSEISMFEYRFHPLASSRIHLFINGGPAIDPDIVGYADKLPTFVIDCKYSCTSAAVADDVYQILAYTNRLEASTGLLIYLSEGVGWIQRLGENKNGSHFWAIGADKSDPIKSLRELLEEFFISSLTRCATPGKVGL